MSRTTYCTAATLQSVLLFINSGVTPNIACDDDKLSDMLVAKIKVALGNKAGSQPACIRFDDDEADLERQFAGVCLELRNVFDGVLKVHEEVLEV